MAWPKGRSRKVRTVRAAKFTPAQTRLVFSELEKRVAKLESKPAEVAEPATHLEQVKRALDGLEFRFTIFFPDEHGNTVKYYRGAVVQEDRDN